jgi:hypothetical protein
VRLPKSIVSLSASLVCCVDSNLMLLKSPADPVSNTAGLIWHQAAMRMAAGIVSMSKFELRFQLKQASCCKQVAAKIAASNQQRAPALQISG